MTQQGKYTRKVPVHPPGLRLNKHMQSLIARPTSMALCLCGDQDESRCDWDPGSEGSEAHWRVGGMFRSMISVLTIRNIIETSPTDTLISAADSLEINC